MTYNDFIHRLINDGIDAAKKSYATGTARCRAKLAGAIDGFMECRGLQPDAIKKLLNDAFQKSHEAFVRVTEKEISDDEYWRVQCWKSEIEWVANCVSCVLVNQGLQPIIPPTVRAALTVARIVGVQEVES